MNDLPLHDVLDRATDGVEAPGLAAGALAEARRRRLRRRGAVAVLTSSAAVLALVIGVRVAADDPRAEQTPADPASPTATDQPVAPPIPARLVQDVWDPRGVEGLPVLDLGVPRVLPVATTGSVTKAVALLDGPDGALLVGADGGQAVLDLPRGIGRGDVVLSPDGTTVAAVGAAGLAWRPLADGEWRTADIAEVSTGEAGLSWLPDSSGVVVQDHRNAVEVDLAGGSQRELPFLAEHAPYDVAPDGTVVHTTALGELREWRDGEELGRTWTSPLEGIQRLAASDTSVALARSDLSYALPRKPQDADALVAVERSTLRTRAFLPVRDRSGYYVGGENLAPVGWLDDDTVLASVLPLGDATEYLVAWDVESGELSQVTCWPASYAVSFATDLL